MAKITPTIALQRFKALKALSRKAKLGTRIEQNRSLGFGTRQNIETVESQIYGPARETQVGAQSISLGMGREGILRKGRLAKRASTGRIWSSASGRQLAARTAKAPLRVGGATLPRHKVE